MLKRDGLSLLPQANIVTGVLANPVLKRSVHNLLHSSQKGLQSSLLSRNGPCYPNASRLSGSPCALFHKDLSALPQHMSVFLFCPWAYILPMVTSKSPASGFPCHSKGHLGCWTKFDAHLACIHVTLCLPNSAMPFTAWKGEAFTVSDSQWWLLYR